MTNNMNILAKAMNATKVLEEVLKDYKEAMNAVDVMYIEEKHGGMTELEENMLLELADVAAKVEEIAKEL